MTAIDIIAKHFGADITSRGDRDVYVFLKSELGSFFGFWTVVQDIGFTIGGHLGETGFDGRTPSQECIYVTVVKA